LRLSNRLSIQTILAQEAKAPTIGLVAVAADADNEVRLCSTLRAQGSELRIVAVVCCCPEPIPVSDLQDLATHRVNDTGAAPRVDRRHANLTGAPGTGQLHLDDSRLLEFVAQGLSDDCIGDLLHLSGRAVRKHLVRLRRALDVGSREELAAWAGAYGLYQPPARGPQVTLATREVA
jgi:DNA-binding CsgD family transcriptional regulator